MNDDLLKKLKETYGDSAEGWEWIFGDLPDADTADLQVPGPTQQLPPPSKVKPLNEQ